MKIYNDEWITFLFILREAFFQLENRGILYRDKIKEEVYNLLPMTRENGVEVAYEWKYDREYSFYDMMADEEDLKEFIVGDLTGYYLVENDEEVIGYFSFSLNEDGPLN